MRSPPPLSGSEFFVQISPHTTQCHLDQLIALDVSVYYLEYRAGLGIVVTDTHPHQQTQLTAITLAHALRVNNYYYSIPVTNCTI